MEARVLETFKQIINKNHDSTDHIPMTPLFYNGVIAFCGIDQVSESRYFFIEIDGPWETEQILALPKWRGLTIKMEHHETFGPLNDRYFIEFIQAEKDTGDLFETIMQNIFDHITTREEDHSLFTTVFKVLEKWKSFFKRGGFKKLNEEQQRGLFGELWFIKQWIQKNINTPPLLIQGWGGPLSERVDFKTNSYGIEIKTVKDSINKKIRISNEKQLNITEAIPKIFLYVCYLEVSHSIGITLQELVDEIRQHLENYSQNLLIKFNDLLTNAGFEDNEYTDIYMSVLNHEAYEVTEDFPRISLSSFTKGISHVSYSIDLTHCDAYLIETESILSKSM
ncbi:PD-(D/E)XK motif protein [Rossellomorea marisflavi]|uniref:PD-(D/E)XK motif protein n=1 Tax=Rossellomorea marisflavi TaxID=189381 RepID=UPI00345788F2